MTLTSDLTMNFYTRYMEEGWYAEITGNGRTVTVPTSEWVASGSQWRIVYAGIAAKEMTDEVTVVIYDNEGAAVSSTYTDSVRAYAMRMFGRGLDTVLVDMPNYGAAAQEYFSYKTGGLANDQLTDAQKALATETITDADGNVVASASDSAESYCHRMGSSLTLCEPLMKFAASSRAHFDK